MSKKKAHKTKKVGQQGFQLGEHDPGFIVTLDRSYISSQLRIGTPEAHYVGIVYKYSIAEYILALMEARDGTLSRFPSFGHGATVQLWPHSEGVKLVVEVPHKDREGKTTIRSILPRKSINKLILALKS